MRLRGWGIGGVVSVVVGGLALLTSGAQSHYVVFGVVLCLAGVLLAFGPRVPRIGWLATAPLTIAGMFASLLVVRETVCCMFGYHRGLGYPWGWLDSNGTTDSLATIDAWQADPSGLATTVDWFKVVLDGIFWWHVAVLVIHTCGQLWGLLRTRVRSSPHGH